MILRIAAVALAFVLTPPVSAFADQAPQLTLRARIVPAGGTGGGSSNSPNPMVIQEGVTSYVFAASDLCGVGAAEDEPTTLDELLALNAYVWKVTRTGVSHANGKLTFDLEWTRYDGGQYSPAASSRQRLTVNEGGVVPIDMVRATRGGRCNPASVMLEIEAGTIEIGAFADTMLLYDLWLTHQDGTGPKQTRHFMVSAKQGASGSFEFASLRFDVPKLAPNQFDFDLVTRVIGAVKGRLRENGTVDVELETRRIDRLEVANENKPPVARAGGQKKMTLRLDETVEVELPSASGFSARGASSQSPGVSGRVGIAPQTPTLSSALPVAFKDGMIIVSFREFFDDDRFSVLVRVRKE